MANQHLSCVIGISIETGRMVIILLLFATQLLSKRNPPQLFHISALQAVFGRKVSIISITLTIDLKNAILVLVSIFTIVHMKYSIVGNFPMC